MLIYVPLTFPLVSAERLKQSKRYFGELVPDLTVEIKCQNDRIRPLRDKIKSYLNLDARVGIRIDPDEYTVTVYRPGGDSAVLTNGDILTIPELFPGWEVPIAELCPVEFE